MQIDVKSSLWHIFRLFIIRRLIFGFYKRGGFSGCMYIFVGREFFGRYKLWLRDIILTTFVCLWIKRQLRLICFIRYKNRWPFPGALNIVHLLLILPYCSRFMTEFCPSYF